jgi:hypothetical protein
VFYGNNSVSSNRTTYLSKINLRENKENNDVIKQAKWTIIRVLLFYFCESRHKKKIKRAIN